MAAQPAGVVSSSSARMAFFSSVMAYKQGGAERWYSGGRRGRWFAQDGGAQTGAGAHHARTCPFHLRPQPMERPVPPRAPVPRCQRVLQQRPPFEIGRAAGAAAARQCRLCCEAGGQ